MIESARRNGTPEVPINAACSCPRCTEARLERLLAEKDRRTRALEAELEGAIEATLVATRERDRARAEMDRMMGVGDAGLVPDDSPDLVLDVARGLPTVTVVQSDGLRTALYGVRSVVLDF